MKNYFKNIFYGLDMEAQYQGFRSLYFFDLFVAFVLLITGQVYTAMFFIVVGLILGSISNSKLHAMTLERILTNQNNIEQKIDKLLTSVEVDYKNILEQFEPYQKDFMKQLLQTQAEIKQETK